MKRTMSLLLLAGLLATTMTVPLAAAEEPGSPCYKYWYVHDDVDPEAVALLALLIWATCGTHGVEDVIGIYPGECREPEDGPLNRLLRDCIITICIPKQNPLVCIPI